jgi:hypothetical protein
MTPANVFAWLAVFVHRERAASMSDKFRYQKYLVAYLDLVGQREILRKQLAIPTTPEEERDFIETARQSLGTVLVLRDMFQKFFDSATQHDLSRFPPEFHDDMRAAMQVEYVMQGMSDSLVIAVPLDGTNDCCKDMNGIELTFQSICALAIDAFAVGMIFRAGLDIGIAAKIRETNEVYGSAFLRAYQLETEVAESFRFVIGDGLYDFIDTVPTQVAESPFGCLAKHMVANCKRMMKQDLDGWYILDFLGSQVKDTMGDVISPESVLLGQQFAEREYRRFKAAGNFKLRSRYSRLLEYYLLKMKVWGLGTERPAKLQSSHNLARSNDARGEGSLVTTVREETMPANESDELLDNTMIWRYMKFEHIVLMLKCHSLWFARPCKFIDEWEGLLPPSYYRNTRSWALNNGEDWREFEEDFTKRWKRRRYAMFVNCWHIADHESDAMWRLYGKGFAIQSTTGKLRHHLPIHGYGQVRYYDPEKDISHESIFGPDDILYKRISFKHENEYRVWIVDDRLAERIERNEEFDEEGLTPPGVQVSISPMEQVIERMVIAPGTDPSFTKMFKDLCSRYNLSWLGERVEQSYLDQLHPAILTSLKRNHENGGSD